MNCKVCAGFLGARADVCAASRCRDELASGFSVHVYASVGLVSRSACVPPLSLSHSVDVGCIIGRSRPDTAGGVHQAVTRRDREESRDAVRRPF